MIDPDAALAVLGWKPFFSDQLSGGDLRDCQPVRVMAVHRGIITVAGAGRERLISPHLATSRGEEDRPTVGDWLLIANDGTVMRILDRASLFRRRAPGHDRRLQRIAANVDTLFIVASCNQDFSVPRLERYLVLAREVAVRSVVVLTKIDLTAAAERFLGLAQGLQADLAVVCVNAKNPASVAQLAAYCGMGETVALLGSSGVGKSTLVNTLRGSDSIATGPVRDHDGQGRHTTTTREMHRLPHGGWLLDTPGMREFQLTDAACGLAEVFDDIVLLASQCRFSNCTHATEPECAVRSATTAGTLAPERLDRWRKLVVEDISNTMGLAQRKAQGRRGR